MNECGVCIGGYEGERPDFIVYRNLKARKAHICFECGESIHPRIPYERVVGKWDGEVCVFKTCLRCVEIRDSFSCDGSYTFGSLWRDIEEDVFPDMNSACFDKLQTAEAKSFLQDRWCKWKFGGGSQSG